MSRIWIWIHKERVGQFNIGVIKSRDTGKNKVSSGDFEVSF